jgi:cysteine-S-conjugate beta-lyase
MTSSESKISKSTICVHEGQIPDEFRGINTPVFTSTAYGYLDTEERLYPRYFNIPNQKVIIQKLAALEKAENGLIFSSGMAAVSTTLFSLLNQGDHCVFQSGLYGGTLHFANEEFKRFGLEYTVLKNNDLASFESAMKKNTRVVYIESPSNPLLSIIDLEGVSRLCRRHQCVSVIDNTFASPVNQNPIDFGIDIVIHSATKYLGGHSDIAAGAVLAGNRLIEQISRSSISFGGSLNALMCHLLERSLKTLSIRVERQNQNAMLVAEFLNRHQEIDRVFYPGLTHHPGYEIAKRQMTGFGGMLSFELKKQDITSFQKRLQLIRPAMSLGGIESTICAPVTTSHRLVSSKEREEEGIRDNLLRLSVGIEEADDILRDLTQALDN